MDKIDELLIRGVDKIYPKKEDLEKVLRSGKKLKIYQGFDPTGTELHIGHMVGLRKLAQFQKLGHHVIFLIGSATVHAGDPSDKKTARRRLSTLIVGTHKDKPGVLRKIAQSFEQYGVNLTAIDSHKQKGEVFFKVKIDRNTPPENIKKVVNFLLEQGFYVEDEYRHNAKTYAKQATKIINFDGRNPAELLYNGDWLDKLSLQEILNIVDHFTLAQISERDLFQARKKEGEEVSIREALYPILQAYDSVAMNVDLEIGGTDQTFNMLCGRTLVKQMQNREKYVLTTPLLTDAQGAKIGKTEGNVIALTDEPSDLFGKIMTLGDDIIVKSLEYLTNVPVGEISKIGESVQKGDNPMKYKKRLAFEVVKQLNNEDAAQKAQAQFEAVFQKRQAPEEAKEVKVSKSKWKIVDFLVENRLVESKSAAKRLVDQNAIEIDNQTVKGPEVEFKNGQIVKVGKRKFVKIELT